jgi:transcriptional regulator
MPASYFECEALDRRGTEDYLPLATREDQAMPKTDYLQGALDLLILRTLSVGPNHGWGIQQRIKQVTDETLSVSQGSLYPALHRLEAAGVVASEMAASENNRKARVYRLTTAGRKQLDAEAADWRQFSLAMRRMLQQGS